MFEVEKEEKMPAREIVEGPLLSWFHFEFSSQIFWRILSSSFPFAFVFTFSKATHIEQQDLFGHFRIALMFSIPTPPYTKQARMSWILQCIHSRKAPPSPLVPPGYIPQFLNCLSVRTQKRRSRYLREWLVLALAVDWCKYPTVVLTFPRETTIFKLSTPSTLPILWLLWKCSPRGIENLCHRNRPGVFSRVSLFEDWIEKVTGGIVSFLCSKECHAWKTAINQP